MSNDLKFTGIVRKIDELGRVVLPVELRRTLDLGSREKLDLHVQDQYIYLSKSVPEKNLLSRKIDELGRFVLPMELRKSRELNVGTPMEFYTEGNSIVLKKPGCCSQCGK